MLETSLSEALDQLDNAIEGRRKSYKYVILHFSHFCELIFKYYISKHHPLIIYQDVFKKKINFKEAKIIGFWDALTFIVNEEKQQGSEFIEGLEDDLNQLKTLKNQIEHSHFEINLADLRMLLGRLIRMIDKFNQKKEIFDFNDWVVDGWISKKHMEIYETLLDEYKHGLQEALQKVQDAKHEAFDGIRQKDQNEFIFPIYRCSACDQETLIKNKNSPTQYQCAFCKAEDSEYLEIACGICTALFPQGDMTYLVNFSEWGSIYICPRCKNRA